MWIYFTILAISKIAIVHGNYHGMRRPFPYQALFDDFDTSVNKTRVKAYLCGVNDKTCCHCYQGCVKTRSCCIDSGWKQHNGSLSAYLDWTVKRALPYSDLECKPLLAGAQFMDVSNYMMIGRCLLDNSSKNEFNCRNGELLLPVLGSNGIVYKNEFCAKCNNESDFRYLGLKVTCNVTRDIFVQQSISFDYENCTIRPNIETINLLWQKKVFPCHYPTNYGKGCNPSNPHYMLCNSYLAYSNGFTNPHCMKCANHSAKVRDFDECPKPHSVRGSLLNQIELKFSYALVISLDASGCSPGSVLDTDGKRCTSFRCHNRLKGKGSLCGSEKETGQLKDSTSNDSNRNNKGKRNFTDDNTDLFTRCLLRKGEVGLIAKCPNYQDLEAQTFNDQSKDCLKGGEFEFHKMRGNGSLYEYLQGSPLSFVENLNESCFEKQWLDNFNCRNIQVISVKKQNYNILYRSDPMHNFPNGKVCHKIKKLLIKHVTMNDDCSILWKKKAYKYEDYLLIKTFTGKQEKLKHVVVCNQFHLRSYCPKKELDIMSDYHFDDRKHLIPKEEGKMSYSPDLYIPHENGVKVCDDIVTVKGTRYKEIDLAKHYITVFGLPSSILGYTLVVIVYSCFKELHNKIGFSVIWLCVSLAVSDGIMTALAVEYIERKMHEIVAIALHWCFLDALSWIIVISVELLDLLKNEYVLVQQNLSSRCFQTWILATAAPSVVIASLVFLNHYHPSWIGYGRFLSNNLMTNRMALYLTVLAPFLATNVVSFGISTAIVVKIYMHRRAINQSGITSSNGHGNINLAKTAMKLVALLGVAELLGLVQTKHAVIDALFSTLYVFVRSTRGIFICLLYVFNCNVRRLLKRKMQRITASVTRESTLEID